MTIFWFWSSSLLWILSPNFEPYTAKIPNSEVSFTMVPIEGGSFTLGAVAKDKAAETDEYPAKSITIDPFWMGAYELSYDEYDIFLNAAKDLDENGNPREDAIVRPSPPYEDPSHGMSGFGYPAVGITQFAALQYCKWLSDKTGDFYRLPTEAEWEYACKAGSDQVYFFGKKSKSLKDYAWFDKNSNQKIHKSGQLKPNPWGLYDILGNVMEWTLDQYQADFYNSLSSGTANPWSQPSQLHPRTVKGGGFNSNKKELRCSDRVKSDLEWKRRDPQVPKSFWWNTDAPFVGFRIVRPYKEPSPEEQATFWEMNLGG